MEAITQYFDHYVISARVKPAFFVVLPLAVTSIAWLPQTQQLGGAILTFLVSFGVIGFFSNLISNAGNVLQVRLFNEWGGAPTTTLLRFSDTHLDSYTKRRYHRQLEEMIPSLIMPTQEQEIANSSDADECYTSAAVFLREHSRDKSKYPLVYADNVAYGYARNLLVMKPWGIMSAAIAIAMNLVLFYPEISAHLQMGQEGSLSWTEKIGLLSTVVSFVMLWVFTFTVNREYVKGRAVRYAKSLLTVCDTVALKK